LYFITNDYIPNTSLKLLIALAALVWNNAVNPKVSVDSFLSEIIVGHVGVGITVTLGSEEDAGVKVRHTQLRVHWLVVLDLQVLKCARQSVATFCRIVLNQCVIITLLVSCFIGWLLQPSKFLKYNNSVITRIPA
jgi:hypothetical protein